MVLGGILGILGGAWESQQDFGDPKGSRDILGGLEGDFGGAWCHLKVTDRCGDSYWGSGGIWGAPGFWGTWGSLLGSPGGILG